MKTKVFHDLNFEKAHTLYWYTGLYLGLPRVFMNIVRAKLSQHDKIAAVLVPLYHVTDPVTKTKIAINITDHYFFIGTTTPILDEYDIGLHTHTNISLIRDSEVSTAPSTITPSRIQKVINVHIDQRAKAIQEDVTVRITGGTFKNWYGVVQEKSLNNPEYIHVKFMSDEYECTTEMPTALCKATC